MTNFSRLFGALALAAVSGCGTTASTLTCNPECPVGFHCAESGCVPDDGTGADLATATVDAGGAACAPACSGANPHCNPRGLCVQCLEDVHCPTGQVCK